MRYIHVAVTVTMANAYGPMMSGYLDRFSSSESRIAIPTYLDQLFLPV